MPAYRADYCCVCKTRIAIPGGAGPRACLDPRCRAEWSRRTKAGPGEKCRVCLRPIDFHQARRGVCDDGFCQGVALRRGSEQRFRAARSYARQVRRLETKLRRSADATPYFVQVPVLTRELAPVSAERRARLEARLRELFRRLRNEEPPAEPPAPPAPPPRAASQSGAPTAGMLAHACRTCRGSCCQYGKEHAFLTVENMRQRLREAPERGEEAIVARYLEHIPAEASVDSCVFHAADGCALPTGWRGTLCNEYFCNSLKKYMERPGRVGQDVVFTATDDDSNIVRAGLTTGETYRAIAMDPEAD